MLLLTTINKVDEMQSGPETRRIYGEDPTLPSALLLASFYKSIFPLRDRELVATGPSLSADPYKAQVSADPDVETIQAQPNVPE